MGFIWQYCMTLFTTIKLQKWELLTSTISWTCLLMVSESGGLIPDSQSAKTTGLVGVVGWEQKANQQTNQKHDGLQCFGSFCFIWNFIFALFCTGGCIFFSCKNYFFPEKLLVIIYFEENVIVSHTQHQQFRDHLMN